MEALKDFQPDYVTWLNDLIIIFFQKDYFRGFETAETQVTWEPIDVFRTKPAFALSEDLVIAMTLVKYLNSWMVFYRTYQLWNKSRCLDVRRSLSFIGFKFTKLLNWSFIEKSKFKTLDGYCLNLTRPILRWNDDDFLYFSLVQKVN